MSFQNFYNATKQVLDRSVAESLPRRPGRVSGGRLRTRAPASASSRSALERKWGRRRGWADSVFLIDLRLGRTGPPAIMEPCESHSAASPFTAPGSGCSAASVGRGRAAGAVNAPRDLHALARANLSLASSFRKPAGPGASNLLLLLRLDPSFHALDPSWSSRCTLMAIPTELCKHHTWH